MRDPAKRIWICCYYCRAHNLLPRTGYYAIPPQHDFSRAEEAICQKCGEVLSESASGLSESRENVKMTKEPKYKSAAVLTINGAPSMSKKGRQDVASWLRSRADDLEETASRMNPTFRARFIYPEGTSI